MNADCGEGVGVAQSVFINVCTTFKGGWVGGPGTIGNNKMSYTQTLHIMHVFHVFMQ